MTGTPVIRVRRSEPFLRLRGSRGSLYLSRFTVIKSPKLTKICGSLTMKLLRLSEGYSSSALRATVRCRLPAFSRRKVSRLLQPTALSKGRDNGHKNAKLHRWSGKTISHILDRPEYIGHTVNFRTHKKSYKNKKTVKNPQEEWLIFENTHEPIVTQQEFDLVQELRKNKRRPTKHEEVNPFSGMVYCADCGKKMYLCRATSLTADQEHLKCSTYSSDKDACSAHFIRTIVLNEIVLNELNKLLVRVKEHEDEFVQAAMDNSVQKQTSELSKAKKAMKQAEKRIAELDRLFTRLYEDNVSGKISDERFTVMSSGYEDEQKKLRDSASELTPEIMHELIEKIVVHAPDKSSGHRTQQIDIYYRFDVAVSTAVADSMKYDKKRKVA